MATLRQLQVFAEVVRCGGSVTHAAARLYVSQPSVSDTLRALEKSLGAKMFAGRGKARALTPAGETYWEYTRRVLELLDEAAQAVADSGDRPRGRLSIVAVPTAGEYLVPDVLRAFVDAYPEVTVTLMVANRADATESLREGVADLAIMGRPPAGLSAENRRFGENRLLLLCGPDHPLADTKPSFDALAATPFLLREQGSGTRAAIEELFNAADLELRQTMVLGSNLAVLAAVREGLGIAVVPEIAAADSLRNGEVVELDVPSFPMFREWHLVWLSTRPLSTPASAFMAMMTGEDNGTG
jgi:LysR family transcriptional regulator, low CO2-responsive transcriptional regulator